MKKYFHGFEKLLQYREDIRNFLTAGRSSPIMIKMRKNCNCERERRRDWSNGIGYLLKMYYAIKM